MAAPDIDRVTRTTPDEFREEAEACRLRAGEAASPEDAAAWLQLAADWLRLANQAQRKH
jgi:hypothetical protein